MEDVDAVVIGAGVIGLAVARELALSGRAPLVLEAAEHFGTATSAAAARSSTPASTIRRGHSRRGCASPVASGCTSSAASAASPPALRQADRGHRHRAASCTRGAAATAGANGVALVALEAAAARRLEPELLCCGRPALPLERYLSIRTRTCWPCSGRQRPPAPRLPPEARSPAWYSRARAPCSESTAASPHCGPARSSIAPGCRRRASRGAWKASPRRTCRAPWFAKGNYFTLSGPPPFRHLIYPLPDAGGLGIHLTLDLAGRARFGPDVEWLESADYAVDPARAAHFETAIRAYLAGFTARGAGAGVCRDAPADLRPRASRRRLSHRRCPPCTGCRICQPFWNRVPRGSRPRWRSPARPWPGWVNAAFS